MKKEKSPILFRIISLICLIMWMGLIFYMSHQTADESSAVSSGLIERAVKLIVPDISAEVITDIISQFQFLVRKGAHFTIYAVLGVLSFEALVTYGISLPAKSFLSVLISFAYSVSDEYHQTFIVGRSGELRDVLIDTSGAIIGVLSALLVYKLQLYFKSRRVNKMKKKQYIQLTDELSRRLNSEKIHSKELTRENSQLAEEISQLNAQLLELRERLSSLEAEAEIEEIAPKATEIEVFPVLEEKPITVPKIASAKPPVPEPQLSDSVSIGAKIIGKIVLSSAEYCNKLTSLPIRSNTKELVNLILGRTEVAKSEILRLSKTDLPLEQIQNAMENELSETVDYFKSVMAQK